MKGKTSYEIVELMKKYSGKWMHLQGPLDNLSEGEGENLVVVIDLGGDMRAGLRFDRKKWAEQLSILPVREPISAAGKIDRIERWWIWLTESELEP